MPKDRLAELRQVDKQYRIVVHLGVSVVKTHTDSKLEQHRIPSQHLQRSNWKPISVHATVHVRAV